VGAFSREAVILPPKCHHVYHLPFCWFLADVVDGRLIRVPGHLLQPTGGVGVGDGRLRCREMPEDTAGLGLVDGYEGEQFGAAIGMSSHRYLGTKPRQDVQLAKLAAN
jgi:hypothetical protein